MIDLERTLVILKPDTIQRGYVGEIISRFEKAGLKIIAMKMVSPDKDHFHKHYEGISGMISRWGEEIFFVNLAAMTEAPVIAFILEGVDAVYYVRKLVGTTDPKDSPPGTIRGDYTHITREYAQPNGSTLPNVLHASGNKKEAIEEISLWFSEDEVYGGYENVHGPIVRGFVPKK